MSHTAKKFFLLLNALMISISASANDCFNLASQYHGVNSGILRAISIKENRRCDSTISKNTNGSIDVGCMQINSIHFPTLAKFGIEKNDLLDSCKNIFVGAWHYKRMILKHGNTWTAVGAYHSETPKFRDPYAADVYRIWMKYGLNTAQNDNKKQFN